LKSLNPVTNFPQADIQIPSNVNVNVNRDPAFVLDQGKQHGLRP
jgi:hypothetical protein